jgi:hypothetical protein
MFMIFQATPFPRLHLPPEEEYVGGPLSHIYFDRSDRQMHIVKKLATFQAALATQALWRGALKFGLYHEKLMHVKDEWLTVVMVWIDR